MDKDDFIFGLIVAVFVIFLLAGGFGFRVWRAHHLYHDSRCIWAECRISK